MISSVIWSWARQKFALLYSVIVILKKVDLESMRWNEISLEYTDELNRCWYSGQ